MANVNMDYGASWVSPGAGITTSYNGNSETLRITVVLFTSLAMYNAVELIFMVFLSFRRYRGLYFWSLLCASIGIIPYALGFLLKFMEITTGDLRWLAVFFLTIGWYPMITGESLVLWSRLHLIVHGSKGERIINWTKWMIIVNAIVLHIPTTVLTFGANSTTETQLFERAYNIMEKIQMIGFFIQELILSSIYIVEAARLLRTSPQAGARKTMKQLIAINIVIIVLDVGLLGLECASLYILETLLKGIIYSLKLKLEFAILGKLIKFVCNTKPGRDRRKSSIGFICSEGKVSHDLDPDEFVDMTRISTDVSNPARARRPLSRLDEAVMDSAYDMARFEHITKVSSLRDPRDRRDSQSPLRNGDDLV